jgi:hypothetical protein
MRTGLNFAIRKLLLALGAKPGKVDYYRDIALAFLVFLGVVLLLSPIVDIAVGHKVTGADLRWAAEGLVVILLFCFMSPNWGDVLAAALALAAFRGAIGFVATRSVAVLLLSGGLLVLAAVFHRLRPGTYG